jgi:hypothetical protein
MTYLIVLAAFIAGFTWGYFHGKRLESESWRKYLSTLAPELKKALLKRERGK